METAPGESQTLAQPASAGWGGLTPGFLVILEGFPHVGIFAWIKDLSIYKEARITWGVLATSRRSLKCSGASNENGKVEKAKGNGGKGRLCGRKVRDGRGELWRVG